MSRTSGWMLILWLTASNMAYAQDRDTQLVNMWTERDQWQQVDPQMTAEDYREVSRNNYRLARRALTAYSYETLNSLSVPEMGVNLLGAAVGMAASTASFHVNKSKTMAVEFENLAEEKRALVFKVKINW